MRQNYIYNLKVCFSRPKNLCRATFSMISTEQEKAQLSNTLTDILYQKKLICELR